MGVINDVFYALYRVKGSNDKFYIKWTDGHERILTDEENKLVLDKVEIEEDFLGNVYNAFDPNLKLEIRKLWDIR